MAQAYRFEKPFWGVGEGVWESITYPAFDVSRVLLVNDLTRRVRAPQSASPMCNLQVSRIKKRASELIKNGLKIISVFERTPVEMKR